ncbi:unnamed protein product [Plutella xylostella]|uniref:(diamondback moth) hypothetical protein n=1 Tax=Plutella xylostella TaxID=51655 RepID=A0A8S4G8L1_PLUXY|nr:unnamed protein product [Plutella xylostella]
MKTLNECIIKTGGVNKAIKKLEINKKKHFSNRKKINDMATNFYRKLYSSNLKDQTNPGKIREDEAVPEILISEVIAAIKSQKMEKAPGLDPITYELLKGTLDEIAPALTIIFNAVMDSEEIPDQWTKSLFSQLKDINMKLFVFVLSVFTVLAVVLGQDLTTVGTKQDLTTVQGTKQVWTTQGFRG